MELSLFTDYTLRVLMYMAARQKQRVTIAELALVYPVSRNHLVKIVFFLGKEGFLETRRGRNGGFWLSHPPESIRVGDVVRKTETSLDIAICFNSTLLCPLSPACRLKGALQEARDAFMHVLDDYTIADLALHPPQAFYSKPLAGTLVPD